MRRFVVRDGELVESSAGDLVRFEDVQKLLAVAGAVAGDRDRYRQALAWIAGVPVTLPLREVVGVAREAISRKRDA